MSWQRDSWWERTRDRRIEEAAEGEKFGMWDPGSETAIRPFHSVLVDLREEAVAGPASERSRREDVKRDSIRLQADPERRYIVHSSHVEGIEPYDSGIDSSELADGHGVPVVSMRRGLFRRQFHRQHYRDLVSHQVPCEMSS